MHYLETKATRPDDMAYSAWNHDRRYSMDDDSLIIIIVGAFLSFVAGYVLGREHAKWEMKSVLSKKLPSPPF
jgi:hypothetical protein